VVRFKCSRERSLFLTLYQVPELLQNNFSMSRYHYVSIFDQEDMVTHSIFTQQNIRKPLSDVVNKKGTPR
jgi:hypothetical protein